MGSSSGGWQQVVWHKCPDLCMHNLCEVCPGAQAWRVQPGKYTAHPRQSLGTPQNALAGRGFRPFALQMSVLRLRASGSRVRPCGPRGSVLHCGVQGHLTTMASDHDMLLPQRGLTFSTQQSSLPFFVSLEVRSHSGRRWNHQQCPVFTDAETEAHRD